MAEGHRDRDVFYSSYIQTYIDRDIASAFTILDKGSVPRGAGAIICLREELSAIDRKTFILPIWMI